MASDCCSSGLVTITSTVPELGNAGVVKLNSPSEMNWTDSAATPPIVIASFAFTPGISWMNPVPVILISVPPASSPLDGKMLVIVGTGLYTNVPFACCPSGLVMIISTSPDVVYTEVITFNS